MLVVVVVRFTNESRWDRPSEPARSRSGRFYPSGEEEAVDHLDDGE